MTGLERGFGSTLRRRVRGAEPAERAHAAARAAEGADVAARLPPRDAEKAEQNGAQRQLNGDANSSSSDRSVCALAERCRPMPPAAGRRASRAARRRSTRARELSPRRAAAPPVGARAAVAVKHTACRAPRARACAAPRRRRAAWAGADVDRVAVAHDRDAPAGARRRRVVAGGGAAVGGARARSRALAATRASLRARPRPARGLRRRACAPARRRLWSGAPSAERIAAPASSPATSERSPAATERADGRRVAAAAQLRRRRRSVVAAARPRARRRARDVWLGSAPSLGAAITSAGRCEGPVLGVGDIAALAAGSADGARAKPGRCFGGGPISLFLHLFQHLGTLKSTYYSTMSCRLLVGLLGSSTWGSEARQGTGGSGRAARGGALGSL